MGMNKDLIHEINNEIERAKAKWGELDEDLREMLNGVTEELLEVVHAVNHREGSAKVHEEIVHAMGVLVRLDEMAGNPTSHLSKAADTGAESDDEGYKELFGILAKGRNKSPPV